MNSMMGLRLASMGCSMIRANESMKKFAYLIRRCCKALMVPCLIVIGLICFCLCSKRSSDILMPKVSKKDVQTPASEDTSPNLPIDIRTEVLRVLDTGIPYAERNAALITIRYTLNANEIAALEKCILEEPCCVGTEIHALKNDIMNLLRKRGGALNEVIGFFCASADVFLAKGDDVMVDYCIQHTAAALEGDVEPNVHAEAMEMLQNATEYPEKSWSATALISLDRLLGDSPEERKFLEARTIELLKASSLDAVRVSCIGVARKNHWVSAIPILKALQKRRDLSMSMRLAIGSALKDL